MSTPFRRWLRIGLISIGSLVVLAALVAVAGIFILRSDWFIQQLRQRVIAEIEKSTGGKVELRELHFNASTLIAEADGLVIHGTEPPDAAPLFQAKKITIGLKLISLTKRQVDISSIDITEPSVDLIFSADGRNNLPSPKTSKPGKPIDETILDLLIGRFGVQNGVIEVHVVGAPPKKLPWNVRGENLKAQLTSVTGQAAPSYKGDISIQPIHVSYGNLARLDSAVNLAVVFEHDHIRVAEGTLQSGSSQIEFSGDMRHLASPSVTGKYNARLRAYDVGHLLNWRARQSGAIESTGEFRFDNSDDFLVSGKALATELSYRDPDLFFDHLNVSTNFTADPKKIDLANLRAWFLSGEMRGHAKLTDADHFEIEGTLAAFAAKAVADLLRTTPPPFDFRFSGPFDARGSISGLKDRRVDASAKLTLSPAGNTPVTGFLDVHFDGARQYADFGKSFLSLPASRLEFSGGLGLQKGAYHEQLQVRLATNNLDDALILAPAIKSLPLSLANGHAEFNGSLNGSLNSPVIDGHVTANNITVEKQSVDAFSADVSLSSAGVKINNGVLAYQKMRARVAGSLGLNNWKPDNRSLVTAMASLQNADIANLLALLGQTGIPVKGALTAEAHIDGTLADPRAVAMLRAGRGSAYGEPFDRATADITYVNGGRQEFTVEMDSGVRKINVTGSFLHAPADFLAGTIQASLKTGDVALNQIRTLREDQPTIGGTARVTADGEVRMVHAKAAEHFEIVNLNADAVTRNFALDEKQLGDLHLTAHTSSAQSPGGPPTMNVQLTSNLAHSKIVGSGSWRLGGNYPGSGEITFGNVNLAEVRNLFAPHATSLASVGGSVEGKITFSGPAENPRAMTGTIEIPKLEIKPDATGAAPIPESLRDLVIQNQGSIRAAMVNGNIRVERARVTARSTDVSLTGTVNLNAPAPLDLRANGNLDLSILPMFDRDLISSGEVAATATIRGAFNQPEILGRLEVKNANLNLEGLPNGLSSANGTVIFDPSRATIQSLSAETGGGKVNMTGFVAFSNGPMALRLEAVAKSVRVRYPEGVSTVADANLRLIGTTERSTLSGTITVVRSAFTPHTDLANLLASASAPVQTPAVQTGLVGNMQFDVDILTAPDVSFQTSLAQGLQADANLRLRGTLSNPVLLGRVNISQGDLTFFGNKYTINQGSISFFNPVKMEPVLDVSLDTKARGVDVTINVTGPVTKLDLSYRSDPPLQFADLVALLATGRTPENPNIAAQDTTPSQTWQGLGASALLGQAIANPLAGRLQRFFGVSKIKIDPLLTGVGGNAQARLTIEQNVTPDLTFTYITNVNSSTGSAQVIRAEWDFNRQWSAVATRDEYGYFGIDFQYRKRLK